MTDKNYIQTALAFQGFKYSWILNPFTYNGRYYVEVKIYKPMHNKIYKLFNVRGCANKLINVLEQYIDKEYSFIKQLKLAQKFNMNLFS